MGPTLRIVDFLIIFFGGLALGWGARVLLKYKDEIWVEVDCDGETCSSVFFFFFSKKEEEI